MTKRLSAHDRERHARARRDTAIARQELGWGTVPREPAASPTSMAVKAEDPEIRALIDAALAKKACG